MCLGLCALWVRSYWVWEGFGSGKYLFTDPYKEGSGEFPQDHFRVNSLNSMSGRIGLDSWIMNQDGGDSIGWTLLGWVQDWKYNSGSAGSFDQIVKYNHSFVARYGFVFNVHSNPHFEIQLLLPIWFLILLSVVFPTYWWMPRRKTLPGCCVKCGYDLRATPERCPECGTVALTKSA